MSIINFSINGYEGEQYAHLRSSFPVMKAEIYASNGSSYDGHTHCISGTDQDVYEIDSVVWVTKVAEAVRYNEEEFWSSLQTKGRITFIVTLISGLVLGTAAVALGVLVAPLIPIAVAIGFIALPILAYSFLMFYRSSQAADQVALWKNEERVGELVHQRQQAGKRGFEYVNLNQLVNVVVSTNEYMGLWLAKVNHYIKEFDHPNDRIGQVKDFMRVALFDEKTLLSVFKTRQLPNILKAKKVFKELQDKYNSLSSIIENALKLIREEEAQLHLENDHEKVRRLAPIESLYQKHRSHLDDTSQLQQLELIYCALKGHIENQHVQNTRQINTWANGRLSEEANSDRQIARFHPAIRKLLTDYHGFEDIYVDLYADLYDAEDDDLDQPSPTIHYEDYIPEPQSNFDSVVWSWFQQTPS